MPRTSEAQQQARREQILAAARHCFARRGFAETSIRDIQDEARLSAGALYLYFGSKDEIVEALADEVLVRVADWVDALDAADDPADALERLLRTLVATAAGTERDELGLRAQAWGAAVTHPRIASMLSSGLGKARAAISRAVARVTGQSAPDADATARAVLALMHGFVLQVLFDPPADPAAYAESCVLMMRSTLHPDAAPS